MQKNHGGGGHHRERERRGRRVQLLPAPSPAPPTDNLFDFPPLGEIPANTSRGAAAAVAGGIPQQVSPSGGNAASVNARGAGGDANARLARLNVRFSDSKQSSTTISNGFFFHTASGTGGSGGHSGGRKTKSLPIQQLKSPEGMTTDERIKPRLSSIGVNFQRETDGRSNFPNQRDFQDFCKQRDLFYEIKEIWTLKQSDPSSTAPLPTQGLPSHINAQNYDPAFGKMRTLFQMNSSPTNLIRLSALFLSQCVLDSAYSSSQVGVNVAVAENNVRRFLQSNPSKLEQLRQRVAAPIAAVEFIQISDPMVFLKYFINSTHAPVGFMHYLMDRAVADILEVETSAEEENLNEKEILELMKKSSVLAKMLGYLYFYPYRHTKNPLFNPKSPQKPSEVHLKSQAALRSYQRPPLDFFAILKKSLAQNRLVFTLPWILEFVAQVDPAVFFMDNYKPTLSLICSIYKEILMNQVALVPSSPSGGHFNLWPIGTENRQFLRFYFETLTSCENFRNFLTKSEARLGEFLADKQRNSVSGEIENDKIHLDSKDFIGATLSLVYFQKELKSIVVDSPIVASTAQADANSPVPPSPPPSPFPDRYVESSVQEELESQFFQIQPPSLKKTLDFISERVASNFMKKLKKILQELKTSLQAKMIFENEAVALAKDEIQKLGGEFCGSRCQQTVGILLEDGFNEAVQAVCVKICQKKAQEKIEEWVKEHVKTDLFPVLTLSETSDSEPEPQPISETAADTATATEAAVALLALPEETLPLATNHLCSFEAMINLHQTSRKLHNGEVIPSAADIEKIFQPSILKQKPWIYNSTVTLALEILTFQPTLLTPELQSKFISFWSKFSPPDCGTGSGLKILSPRNVALLCMGKSQSQTWSGLATLFQKLIGVGFVDLEEFDKDFGQVQKYSNWETGCVAENLKFLKEIVHALAEGAESQVEWQEFDNEVSD